MNSVDWQNIIQGAFLLLAAANVISAGFFWKMRATFVSQKDIEALENKLEKRLKEVVAGVAEKAEDSDMDALEARLRAVENIGAVQAAQLVGVRDIMVRIEHQVGLLVEYRMLESKP